MISAAPECTDREIERVQRVQRHPLHDLALLATRVLPGSALTRGLVRLSRGLDRWARSSATASHG